MKTRYYRYGWPVYGLKSWLLYAIDSALTCDLWKSVPGRHRLICTCGLAKMLIGKLTPPVRTKGIS